MKRYGEKESVVMKFAGLQADYAAAKSSKYRRARAGLPGMGAGADYHYRSDADYLRMMEIARDMDRNDVVIGRLIDTAVTNTIQNGIPPDIDTGDVKLDKDLKQAWETWAHSTDCSLTRTMTYFEMEALCLRSMLLDGDILPMLGEFEDSPCIQMMEAHRLRTPRKTQRNIKLGIQKDPLGRPLRYWFTKEDVDGMTPVNISDMVGVEAFDEDGQPVVLHIIRRKRSSQTRGVTALAPIIDTASQFEDIQFATLVQRQIVSCLTFIRERALDFSANGQPAATGAQTTEIQSDGSQRTVNELAPGAEIWGAPGEKITPASPQVPNAEYFPHVRLVLSLMSVNFGVPLCILMLDGSETNFSGWRGAVDQARMGWRTNQQIIVNRWSRPNWSFWVRHFLAKSGDVRRAAQGIIKAKAPELWAKFNPLGYPYIQPLEDAKASDLRVKTFQNSLRREHNERGSDWDAVKFELVDDQFDIIKHAIKRAKELNADDAEAKVTWRDLLNKDSKPDAGEEKPEEDKAGNKQGGKAA